LVAALHFRRRVMISDADTGPPFGVLRKDSDLEQSLHNLTQRRNTAETGRLHHIACRGPRRQHAGVGFPPPIPPRPLANSGAAHLYNRIRRVTL